MPSRTRGQKRQADKSLSPKKDSKVVKKKESCRGCKKEFVQILNHLRQRPSCKANYPNYDELKQLANDTTRTNMKEKQKIKYHQNKEAKQMYYLANRDKILAQQRNYKLQNRAARKEKEAERKIRKKAAKTAADRINQFRQQIHLGLNYYCNSCNRQLFRRSVLILQPDQWNRMKEKCGINFLKTVLHEVPMHQEHPLIVLCHNCNKIILSKKIPNINVSNELLLDEVPPELAIMWDLEQQLIVPEILFMKIFEMRKSGMPKLVNKVINVPLHESDIISTLSKLPRMPDDSALLNVIFKRKKDMKNTVMQSYIRPNVPYRALEKLKELGNPFFEKIDINKNFLEDFSKLCETEDNVQEDDDGDNSDDEKSGLRVNNTN